MNRMLKYLLYFSMLFFIFESTYAQKVQKTQITCGLFDRNEPLEMSLSFDIRKIRRDVYKKSKKYEAQIAYLDSSQKQIVIDLKISTRGNYRRNSNNCNFPPLKLDFPKTKIEGTVFNGLNKVKMVTHCITNNENFEQYILHEFLLYKIYNILTDKSLKVRLVKVKYKDTRGKIDEFEKYAFLIEPIGIMSERAKCVKLDKKKLPFYKLDYKSLCLLSVFQYMIGNADWSVSEGHNIKFIQSNESTIKPVAIPYDFDWTGMINASYAKPSKKLNISSIKERVYRGVSIREDVIENIAQLFINKKSEIENLYRDFKPLNSDNKKNALEYINSFYEILLDKEKRKVIFKRE